MINDMGFYSPPSRHERKIERNRNLLHCLGGALLGALCGGFLFMALAVSF